jgi:AcrR family transcriptional regulator
MSATISTPKSSAETRRAERKEKRREELVDAALRVFSRVGFATAKMEDVAVEAGTSKGTVYLYFDSKEHLFEEMVKAKMLPLFVEAEAELAVDVGSAEERLKAHVKFFYKKILNSDRRQIMRLIMAEGPNFPHLAECYHANILSRGQAMMMAIIEEGVEKGEFRALNGHGLAQNVFAGALLAAMWKLIFDPYQPLDLDAYYETHVDLVLNGLKAT